MTTDQLRQAWKQDLDSKALQLSKVCRLDPNDGENDENDLFLILAGSDARQVKSYYKMKLTEGRQDPIDIRFFPYPDNLVYIVLVNESKTQITSVELSKDRTALAIWDIFKTRNLV
jgi:hypothetical protein